MLPGVVLSQNAVTQGQRAPKDASAAMALANLAAFGAIAEDEVGTDSEE